MSTGRSTSSDSRAIRRLVQRLRELQQADACVETGEQATTGLSPRRAAPRRFSIGSDPTGDTLTMSAALLVVADRPQPIPTIDSTIACTAVEWAASQTRNKGLGVAVATDGCEMVRAMVDRLAAYPWPRQRPETPA